MKTHMGVLISKEQQWYISTGGSYDNVCAALNSKVAMMIIWAQKDPQAYGEMGV